jgi:hypothetical protein
MLQQLHTVQYLYYACKVCRVLLHVCSFNFCVGMSQLQFLLLRTLV